MPARGVENIADAVRRALAPAGLDLLSRAAEACAADGASLYLVGGAVRDALLGGGGTEPDLDLVIEGGDASTQDAAAAAIGEVAARSEFMTLKIRAGALNIDLVRARSESYPSPGALPEVRPGPLAEDLARRDFSINAMAARLDAPRWGDLIDPHGGAHDLERRTVRALHDRSFEDDPTRIFRAVRYAGRLGFDVEAETRAQMRRNLPHVAALSADRVRHELERIFAEPLAPAILALARNEGALAAVHPALGRDRAALERAAASGLPDGEARDAVLLAALLWDASPTDTLAVRDRLRLDAGMARAMTHASELRAASGWPPPAGLAPSEIVARLQGYDAGALEACARLTTRPRLRAALRSYLDSLRHVRPALTGADLIALGVPQGPQVGRMLAQLRDARLDGLLATRRDEERWLQERIPEPPR